MLSTYTIISDYNIVMPAIYTFYRYSFQSSDIFYTCLIEKGNTCRKQTKKKKYWGEFSLSSQFIMPLLLSKYIIEQ